MEKKPQRNYIRNAGKLNNQLLSGNDLKYTLAYIKAIATDAPLKSAANIRKLEGKKTEYPKNIKQINTAIKKIIQFRVTGLVKEAKKGRPFKPYEAISLMLDESHEYYKYRCQKIAKEGLNEIAVFFISYKGRVRKDILRRLTKKDYYTETIKPKIRRKIAGLLGEEFPETEGEKEREETPKEIISGN